MASLRATPQWATAVSQHEVTSLLYRPPSLRWVAWHPRPWHFLLLQRPTGSRLALFLGHTGGVLLTGSSVGGASGFTRDVGGTRG